MVTNIEKMSLEWKHYWLQIYEFDWAWSFLDEVNWNFFIYTNNSDLRKYHMYEMINNKSLLLSTKMFDRLAKGRAMSPLDHQICMIKKPINNG